MSTRRAALALVATACLCPAQRKEYVELQREIALLGEQIRGLKSAMDEQFNRLNLLVQQAVDAAARTNTAVASLDNDLRQSLREQEANVGRPVTAIGTKVDQLAGEFQALRESVAELNRRMGRLELQIVDISTAVRTLQAPPAPPPGAGGPPPGLSAESLYQNALRDKNGGNLELALKEFTDYLQYFGNTELAPNAQFYIGEIYYLRGEMDQAIRAFDLVLEKYPDNNKTPDAHYMKGMALLKVGRRNQARDEFYNLIERFPNHELAAKAKAQLKALGLSPSRRKTK
ncbi:MAG: tetratricopeptide repeat protein [Bryobacterales bacterium]|nr:tetratricopeptide repeat protein [Bryobacteraceae bacterium]MDW8354016.1 tetratricopeptide repeat protein [Bryobacterales bacterium]